MTLPQAYESEQLPINLSQGDSTSIPIGWEIKKLGAICEFENGDRGINYPSKTHRTESGIPFINAGHLLESGLDLNKMDYISRERFNLLGSGKIKNGDILFCLRGSLGKYAKVREFSEGAIASSLVIIRPLPIVTTEFLLLYFDSNICRGMIENFSNGAAQPNLSAGNLKNFEIPLPPLSEQKRIVAKLDEAFSAIAKAKVNAERNLKNAKELFESYLQGVFENKGEDWEERKLGDSDLIEIIDGDRGKNYPTQKDFTDEGYCLFMNTKNVRPTGLEFNSKMFISEAKDKTMGKGKLKRNDVVMTTRGTIGNLGIYNNDVKYDNIRINSGMLIFRPNLNQITSAYLFEILRSGIIKEQITKHVTGAAQPQLPIKTLVNFVFPVPKSIKEQHNIVKMLNSLSVETKRLESIYQFKIRALDELKKSILQKAFSGELTERVVAV